MVVEKNTLELKSIQISLEGEPLVCVSKEIHSGKTWSVMGESGSGKSTLLAYIGGFLDPAFCAKGQVFLNGQDITNISAEKRQVGILFQDPLLFPHMSVGGNLLFAVPQRIQSKQQRIEIAANALEKAGLGEFFDRDPATLSGGQKARVALMRVLVCEPKALLLDEPFSKLDSSRRANIREFVLGEAERQNIPVILVTHDLGDAQAAGGEIHHLTI